MQIVKQLTEPNRVEMENKILDYFSYLNNFKTAVTKTGTVILDGELKLDELIELGILAKQLKNEYQVEQKIYL